uniref:MYCL proto-oncogene, bHLH transcription factor n=1 Tax=Anas platyrhynchos TaxID=8839 RepID=A0A8B9SPH5_ANAPL
MERDPSPHYFYDHDAGEDFHRSTAPSEDIWKKFELVPTPPRSPLGSPGDKGWGGGAEERAGGPARHGPAAEEPEYLLGPGPIFGNLSAFILRDCMWSGFSARERLEKAMTEKLAPGPPRAAPHKPSFGQDLGFSSSVSDCVDPAAVFLCPLADSKVPASSGSEGQSDSEGEEIDVVTVEKRQSLSLRQPVTITLRADPLDPCMKRFHISIHQQQHNYAARSPPDACPQPEPPQQDEEEPLSTTEPTPPGTLPEPGLPKAWHQPRLRQRGRGQEEKPQLPGAQAAQRPALALPGAAGPGARAGQLPQDAQGGDPEQVLRVPAVAHQCREEDGGREAAAAAAAEPAAQTDCSPQGALA